MGRSPRALRAGRAVVVAATLTAGACLGLAGVAAAQDTGVPGTSGDDRAVAFPGNATDCEDAGLPGELIHVDDEGPLTFTSDGTFLDITAIPEDIEVTGVVVKGGPNYNVYNVELLGELPWEGLRSPYNNGGNVPEISHWYACGGPADDEEPPTTTVPPPPPSEEPPPIDAPPTEEPPTSAPPSEPAPPATPPTSGGLAETGVSGVGLLGIIGGGLLLGGSGLLLLMRYRGTATSED